MNKKGRLLVALFLITLVITGCGSSTGDLQSDKAIEPPHNGVFFLEGNSFIETFEYEGPPTNVSPENFPTTLDSQPQFVVWLPQIQLQYFILYNLDNGNDFGYYISDRENGIYDILLEDSLSDGSYCFYQGNPIASPVDIMHWCFSIGDVSDGISVNRDNDSDSGPVQTTELQIISSEGIIHKENLSNLVESVVGKHTYGQLSIDIEEPAIDLTEEEEAFVTDSTNLHINNWENFCNDMRENIATGDFLVVAFSNKNIAEEVFQTRVSWNSLSQDNFIEDLGDQSVAVPSFTNTSQCRGFIDHSIMVQRGSIIFSFDAWFSTDMADEERFDILNDVARSIDNYLLSEIPAAGTQESSIDCSSNTVVCIGLVTDGGSVDDNGINQDAWEGVQAAGEKYGAAKAEYIQPDVDPSIGVSSRAYITKIEQLLDNSYDIIVTVGFSMYEATTIVAKENPDTFFIGIDQSQFSSDTPNLVGLVFKEDHQGFLAGAVAAMLTETNVISGVYGTDLLPQIVAFKEGYEAGAAYVNPDISVISSYHPGGLDVAFNDPEWGAATTAQAINNGADVIFGVGGKTSLGAIVETSKHAGSFCIGVDIDQWLTVPEARPCLVTSTMKQISSGLVGLIDAYMTGNALPGNFYGAAGLAPFHDFESFVTPEMQTEIDKITTGLADGSILGSPVDAP